MATLPWSVCQSVNKMTTRMWHFGRPSARLTEAMAFQISTCPIAGVKEAMQIAPHEKAVRHLVPLNQRIRLYVRRVEYR